MTGSISNGDPVAAIAVWTLIAIGVIASITQGYIVVVEFKRWRRKRHAEWLDSGKP